MKIVCLYACVISGEIGLALMPPIPQRWFAIITILFVNLVVWMALHTKPK